MSSFRYSSGKLAGLNQNILDKKNKIIFHILNDKIDSQNILMRITDREIALLMLNMDENEIKTILSLLSDKKVKRVKEELKYHKKLEIKYKLYNEITDKFISYFINKSNIKQKTYIRPKRKK